jgi:hypothetical protein
MSLETLLGEFAQKETLNADFHNHLQTGKDFRKKPKTFGEWVKNLFLEEGFSDLTGILDRVMKTKLDILYITNSNLDSRYEDWTSSAQLENAARAGYQIEVGQYYVFAKKDGRVIALGKSHEVRTDRGHFLFSGIRRNKRISDGKKLEEVLKEANDGELKIADHPYAMLKGQNGVLAYSKNPEEDARIFDALERNGNFSLPISLANIRAIRKARKYEKPLVADSDGHHPKDIGRTYNVFYSKDLICKTERLFRDSINYAVRQGNFETNYRATPVWRVFHHAFMIGMNYIFGKLDKMKEESRRRSLGTPSMAYA